MFINQVMVRRTADMGRQCGVTSPCRRAQLDDQGHPLLVGGDAERQPLLKTCAGINTLRCVVGRAITHPLHHHAVCGVLHHRLGANVGRGLDHGRFDEHACAVTLARGQSDECRERGMHARIRVARSARDERGILGVSRDRRHGHLLHGLREADALTPRAAQAKGGHTREDHARVDLAYRRGIETPLLHHARREVLRDDISPFDELHAQCAAGGNRHLERDAQLVGVRGSEHVAPLPPLLAPVHRAGEAHAVGMARAFDVDDLGPQQRQQVSRRRPRPPGGEIEHPKTVEGQPAAISTGRRGHRCRAGMHAIAVGIERRRRLRPRGRGVIDAVRATWLTKACRVLDEHTPRCEVLVGQQARAVAHGGDRNAQRTREIDDLVDGVLEHPSRNDAGPISATLATTERRELGIVDEIGALDHDEEVLKHLRRVRVEADVAVFGLFDRRRLESTRRTKQLRPTSEMMRQIGKRRRGDRHHLGHRQVDVLAYARASRPQHCGQRSRRAVGTGQILGDAATGIHGRLGRPTAVENRATFGLNRELGRDPPRVRAGQPERRQRKHHQMWVLRAQSCHIKAHRSEILTNQVGSGEQCTHVCIAGCADHRQLACVQVAEHCTVIAAEIDVDRMQLSCWVATGRFDLDDLGAGVHEQLRRVRSGDVGGEVDHPEVRKSVHVTFRFSGHTAESGCCPPSDR